MIQLYTFPAAFGLRNVSPFCLKVEMALAFLNMDFGIVEEPDPRKSPKGKLPYIVDGAEVIADSDLILDYLDKKSGGALFSQWTDEQKAKGIAYARLAEEHLYWLMVASRWVDDGWWPNVADGFFGSLPLPLRWLVPKVARRQVTRDLKGQGLGIHSRPEQEAFARKDLFALNAAVTDQDFLLGAEVSAYDFAVAALIAGAKDNVPDTWLSPIIGEYTALCEYTERVQKTVNVFANR